MPPERAATVLGAIRLGNGLIALLAPALIVRRLHGRGANPAAPYLLRMFGIRTTLLGLDLLTGTPVARRRAIERAPLIHLTDTAAATAATLTGQLPLRTGITAVAISGVNLALALTARAQFRLARAARSGGVDKPQKLAG